MHIVNLARAHVLALLAAAAAQAGEPAAIPAPPHLGINPFTGRPIALEQKQLALEAARLDEQIAAAEFNRRKFEIEARRLEGQGAATPVPPPAAAVQPWTLGAPDLFESGRAATAPILTDGTRGPAATPVPVRPAVRPSTRQGARGEATRPAASPFALVGIIQGARGARALIRERAGTVLAAPGDMVGGRRVSAVAAGGAVLGGASHELAAGVARIETTDHAAGPQSPQRRDDIGMNEAASTTIPLPVTPMGAPAPR